MTDTDADRTPVACGVKVTDIEQLAPAATLVPQVLVCTKSAALVPVIAMLVIESAAVPPFVSVMAFAALLVFTFWLPNESEVGLSEACETPTPFPLRVAV